VEPRLGSPGAKPTLQIVLPHPAVDCQQLYLALHGRPSQAPRTNFKVSQCARSPDSNPQLQNKEHKHAPLESARRPIYRAGLLQAAQARNLQAAVCSTYALRGAYADTGFVKACAPKVHGPSEQ
jgi:hypothetical protein